MTQTALVISGGGSKGAFAVGVLKSMFKASPDLRFNTIVGTSTGSLISPFVAMGDMDTLEKLYTSVSTNDIITKLNIRNRSLFRNSLFGIKPLFNLITKYYTDNFYDALAQSASDVYLTATCLQTGKVTYFTNKSSVVSAHDQVEAIEDGDMFRRVVLASACQPVLMPPIEIKPGAKPIRQYVDGGVRVYAGIQMAVEMGAEEIFAILLSSNINDGKDVKYDKLYPILLRTIDIFIEGIGEKNVYIPELFNDALHYINNVQHKMRKAHVREKKVRKFFDIENNPFAGRKPVLLHILRPEVPLDGGLDGMTFDPKVMKRMMEEGEKYMDTFISKLKPGDSVLV